MKSVVKPLSYVAMAISFTMSTFTVMAETAEPVKPTAAAASTPAAQPVVHHKHKSLTSDLKAVDSTAAPVADKAAATEKTAVTNATTTKAAVVDKAATVDKAAASTQSTPAKVVAAIPAEKPAEKLATAAEPAKAK